MDGRNNSKKSLKLNTAALWLTIIYISVFSVSSVAKLYISVANNKYSFSPWLVYSLPGFCAAVYTEHKYILAAGSGRKNHSL